MSNIRVFITGAGIISPLGMGLPETTESIKNQTTGLKPLSVFHAPDAPLPVGEVKTLEKKDIPRSHSMALQAAKEALSETDKTPDAIIIGTTTGGIDLTEQLLKEKNYNKISYKYHSAGSVAEFIAKEIDFRGTIITVSTACSSGTLAIILALEYLRSGKGNYVLTGGVDSLCRLTYHGFNSLQLIDPQGARPFDGTRKGMTVAEGAAMLFLESSTEIPEKACAEVSGGGLSCDAYHPAAPHPEGMGAALAINKALKDAGFSFNDIDYINLHGTGTYDNDLSEAKAVNNIFKEKMPYLSSIKGAFGHALAASGAIEAVISIVCINENMIPANSGFKEDDPEIKIMPERNVIKTNINRVLSNSFGFGGNNASLILSKNGFPAKENHSAPAAALSVLGTACLTGAGDALATIESLNSRGRCTGLMDADIIKKNLPFNKIRRLKRLPRAVLSLADSAYRDTGHQEKPGSVFYATGWGSMSETYDFLVKLFEAEEKFSSPSDFIGSVHNAPAGQAGIFFNATGPNVTVTGGNYSFEQALLSASLLTKDSGEVNIIIGADEHHEILSEILDDSILPDDIPSDGGGAIIFRKSLEDRGLRIYPAFYKYAHNNNVLKSLPAELGGIERINNLFGAIFAGIPAGVRKSAEKQLEEIIDILSFKGPVIDYRKFTGEYASASAVAAVNAIRFTSGGQIPGKILNSGSNHSLRNKGILLLGLGDTITAVEVLP